MFSIFVAFLSLLAYARADGDGGGTKEAVIVTMAQQTFCKTCPYQICNNVVAPFKNDEHNVTCWAKGDAVGDSDLWLKSSKRGCYIPEDHLLDYEGNFKTELESCGDVAVNVTQVPANTIYLAECRWGFERWNRVSQFYGRDHDVTLTCWGEGREIMGNPYYFRTTDYCYISGSTLEQQPTGLEWCGPGFGRFGNEGNQPPPTNGAKPDALPTNAPEADDGGEGSDGGESSAGSEPDPFPTSAPEGGDGGAGSDGSESSAGREPDAYPTGAPEGEDGGEGSDGGENSAGSEPDDQPTSAPEGEDGGEGSDGGEGGDGSEGNARRWLAPAPYAMGDQSVGCYKCPAGTGEEGCELVTTYTGDDPVVAQCAHLGDNDRVYMYTTDWCFMDGTDIWVAPWDSYGYLTCRHWEGL